MTERELQTGDKVDKNKMLITEKADYRATVLALERGREKTEEETERTTLGILKKKNYGCFFCCISVTHIKMIE